MTRQELIAFLTERDLAIDAWQGGSGKYRDLYVGTGLDRKALEAVKRELGTLNVPSHLDRITNSEHPDHGKQMLTIPSFWWEE